MIEIPIIEPKDFGCVEYKWLGYKWFKKYIWPLCVKIEFAPDDSIWERMKIIYESYLVEPWKLIKIQRRIL